MQGFTFTKAGSVADAIRAGGTSLKSRQGATTRYIAGGTTLIDLMKLNVETPAVLVDINRLPLSQIEQESNGGVRIGAMVRNSDLAHHPLIQKHYPVLSEALLAGASVQLRNVAGTGGNLLQRTRCMHFRDTVWACNKRAPGSGCSAIQGSNRMLAILGTSEHCIATNPSDMNVAMAALEAKIHVAGEAGTRVVPISEFFLKPGATPQRETVLEVGDLITHVTLPPPTPGSSSHYLKLRDRASYEFALASAAIVAVVRDRKFSYLRIALGGVGTIPWRATETEQMLLGEVPTRETFRRAAEAALHQAKAQTQNGFKIELAKRCITHALSLVTLSA